MSSIPDECLPAIFDALRPQDATKRLRGLTLDAPTESLAPRAP
jgi:hypothetical protein